MIQGDRGSGAVVRGAVRQCAILPISYVYIAMMGDAGLKRATEVAILNANYIAARLEGVLSGALSGRQRLVAHECIIDCRGFRPTG